MFKMEKFLTDLAIIIFILIIVVFIMVANAGSEEPYSIAVKNAIAELGRGEIGANNSGKYVRLYNAGRELPWCAGFVSYILEISGIDCLEYSLSARVMYSEAKRENRLTDNPKAGDLIVFWREPFNGWGGHAGIIEKIDDEYIYTIEGNVGEYPAKVSRFKYDKTDIPKLLGYIVVEQKE